MFLQFDIRRIDIYRKVPKDLTQPTYTGAFISFCTIAIIAFLFCVELNAFLQPRIESVLYVDDPGEQQMISVDLNVSLLNINCRLIGIDIQDEMGRHEVGNLQKMKTEPILQGNGCLVNAKFSINKVPGNFHLSTHAAGRQKEMPIFRHVIHHLRFGEERMDNILHHEDLQTAFNPLFNHTEMAKEDDTNYIYHLKIVPSIYSAIDGSSIKHSYQYAYTYKHSMSPNGQTAIWFRYQLTPITVKYFQKRQPIYHFITTVCAIVGGTFTVTSIFDSVIFTAHQVFKKIELGKQS